MRIKNQIKTNLKFIMSNSKVYKINSFLNKMNLTSKNNNHNKKCKSKVEFLFFKNHLNFKHTKNLHLLN